MIRLIQHAAFCVDIHGPSSIGHCVFEIRIFQTILLCQYIISHKSPALSFTRKEADPFQIQILCMMPLLIFDMVPYTEYRLQKIVPNVLRICNSIVLPASQFDPPISRCDIIMIPEAQLFLCVCICPEGFLKGHRMPRIYSKKHNGIAHGHMIFRLRSQIFPVSAFCFSSHPIDGSCLSTQIPVPGGIHK